MRVAYLLHEFPSLSQTFIRMEVADHVRSGLEIDVYSVTPKEDQSATLSSDDPVRTRVKYLTSGRRTYRSLLLAAGEDLLEGAPGLRAATRTALATPKERYWIFTVARAWRAIAEKYDVVHCHFGNYGYRLAALKAAGALNAKLVVSFHGSDLSRDRLRRLNDYYRLLFAVGDLFLPVSHHWEERLRELGCPHDRTMVQHMGVDVEELSKERRIVGRATQLKIGSIGRFVEKKGHAFTIEALAKIKEKRPDLTVSLELVGDGPLKEEVLALVHRLGIADSVKLHGALPHEAALRILTRCDVVALPSVTARNGDQEGIPVVLMEAMAMRLPIVSTFHSGIPELVEHGKTGFLVQERDSDGIARYIECLADNPMLRATMGDAGFSKVDAQFNSRSLGQKLRQCYHSLVHPHHVVPASRKPTGIAREVGQESI